MIEVGERELKAPGCGRSAHVLGADDRAGSLEGGPRAVGEAGAGAVELRLELVEVGGDLRRHVAKRPSVSGEAEAEIVEPLDGFKAGDELGDRVRGVAMIEIERDPAEQVITGDLAI